jgi:hypothetical protein
MTGGAVASLDRIRTHGFRRWYERQLIECHAWLVSWFLGLIVMVSGIEVAGGVPLPAFRGADGIGQAGCHWYSWKRYHLLLELPNASVSRLYAPSAKPTASSGSVFRPRPIAGWWHSLENHGGAVAACPVSQVRRQWTQMILAGCPDRLLAPGILLATVVALGNGGYP